MSILIKGMGMPKSCYDCYFCRTYDEPNQGYFCIPLFADLHRTDFTKKRIDACPLVEVPPHGRLIDADALMNEFEKAQRTMAQHGREYSCSFMSSSQELSTEWYCVEDMLDNAPTIIPAEGASDGN